MYGSRLPGNVAGSSFVPQVSLMPEVDLVLNHGGNNTFCECLHFGKPMIVLPLFWDQYDNAQRAPDAGIGARLDPYRFEDDEILVAIDRLLGDVDLRTRLENASRRIRSGSGTEQIADLVERALSPT